MNSLLTCIGPCHIAEMSYSDITTICLFHNTNANSQWYYRIIVLMCEFVVQAAHWPILYGFPCYSHNVIAQLLCWLMIIPVVYRVPGYFKFRLSDLRHTQEINTNNWYEALKLALSKITKAKFIECYLMSLPWIPTEEESLRVTYIRTKNNNSLHLTSWVTFCPVYYGPHTRTLIREAHIFLHPGKWFISLTLASSIVPRTVISWWRHQMKTFSALLAFCAENSPVPGEFSAQRSVTRSFDVFFHLHLNKPSSKQSRGWWFETPSGSLWRQCNVMPTLSFIVSRLPV